MCELVFVTTLLLDFSPKCSMDIRRWFREIIFGLQSGGIFKLARMVLQKFNGGWKRFFTTSEILFVMAMMKVTPTEPLVTIDFN